MRNIKPKAGSDMQATGAEKFIRKGGAVVVMVLFMLNEFIAWGPGLTILVEAAGVIAVLAFYIKVRTFSRAEAVAGLLILAAGGISKVVFHAGDGSIEALIPWFIIMTLWHTIKAARSQNIQQAAQPQPSAFNEPMKEGFEYRPGPGGIGGYYQDGKPVMFD